MKIINFLLCTKCKEYVIWGENDKLDKRETNRIRVNCFLLAHTEHSLCCDTSYTVVDMERKRNVSFFFLWMTSRIGLLNFILK